MSFLVPSVVFGPLLQIALLKTLRTALFGRLKTDGCFFGGKRSKVRILPCTGPRARREERYNMEAGEIAAGKWNVFSFFCWSFQAQIRNMEIRWYIYIYMYMCIIYIERERETWCMLFYKSYMYHTCLSNLLSRWCRWGSFFTGVVFDRASGSGGAQKTKSTRFGWSKAFSGKRARRARGCVAMLLWVVSVVAGGIVDSEIPKKPPGMYKT